MYPQRIKVILHQVICFVTPMGTYVPVSAGLKLTHCVAIETIKLVFTAMFAVYTSVASGLGGCLQSKKELFTQFNHCMPFCIIRQTELASD